MRLRQTQHPRPAAERLYERLVGLDEQKTSLLFTLELLLNRARFVQWRGQHHAGRLGLGFLVDEAVPLVILSGDVGCGKTALATSVGSPLARLLDAPVTTLETPSEIRGTGLVGELSARIADVFGQARSAIGTGYGVLVIDEGDDLATSREQLQAHHEDRAGVNVLIKEIDRLGVEQHRIAVLLATNRAEALDPALLRRACLHLRFGRPTGTALEAAWERLLEGVEHSPADLRRLVEACTTRQPGYTHSDLSHRVGHMALMSAYQQARALSVEDLLAALEKTEPSPVFQSRGVHG